MALTTQDIHTAADQLQEQGVKPTLAEVRKLLGGGSFTTISDAMQSWKREQQEEQELQQVDLPSSIDERLQSLGADMWQSAISIANERLAAEREALAVAKVQAQAETDEAQEAVVTLETELAALLEQLDVQIAHAELVAANALESRSELEAVTTQHRLDVDATKKQMSEIQHSLELAQQRSSTTQQAFDDLRIKQDATSAQLTQSRESIARHDSQNKAQQEEIERLQNELKDTKKDLKTVTAERDQLKVVSAEVKGELRAITAERDKLTTSNEKLTMAHAKVEAEYQALDKSHSGLKADLEDTRSELTKVRETVNKNL